MLIVLFSAAWIFFFLQHRQDKRVRERRVMNIAIVEPGNEQVSLEFLAPKNLFVEEVQTSTFEQSSPQHTALLNKAPENITVKFSESIKLTKQIPEIQVFQYGKDYAVGQTKVINKAKASTIEFDQTAPDGMYTVLYSLCNEEGLCERGTFQFILEREYQVDSDAADLIAMNGATWSLR